MIHSHLSPKCESHCRSEQESFSRVLPWWKLIVRPRIAFESTVRLNMCSLPGGIWEIISLETWGCVKLEVKRAVGDDCTLQAWVKIQKFVNDKTQKRYPCTNKGESSRADDSPPYSWGCRQWRHRSLAESMLLHQPFHVSAAHKSRAQSPMQVPPYSPREPCKKQKPYLCSPTLILSWSTSAVANAIARLVEQAPQDIGCEENGKILGYRINWILLHDLWDWQYDTCACRYCGLAVLDQY